MRGEGVGVGAGVGVGVGAGLRGDVGVGGCTGVQARCLVVLR